MYPWLALVTRHFWHEQKTFQFDVLVEAKDKKAARVIVITEYPPEYLPWLLKDRHEGQLVAYFTGAIYGL